MGGQVGGVVYERDRRQYPFQGNTFDKEGKRKKRGQMIAGLGSISHLIDKESLFS